MLNHGRIIQFDLGLDQLRLISAKREERTPPAPSIPNLPPIVRNARTRVEMVFKYELYDRSSRFRSLASCSGFFHSIPPGVSSKSSNCLFQMSILVRKPAQHDLLVGSRKADVTAFEPFDYSHVLDKFPKADKKLVSRLGHAITRRRQYLKYRERHAMKLRQGIDKVTNVSRGDERTALSETVATDLHNWHIDFDDKASESGFS
jgi:hypothetical protein